MEIELQVKLNVTSNLNQLRLMGLDIHIFSIDFRNILVYFNFQDSLGERFPHPQDKTILGYLIIVPLD